MASNPSREILLQIDSFPFYQGRTTFEVVVIRPSRAFKREARDVMPDLRGACAPEGEKIMDTLLVVLTLQKTSVELIDFSETTEEDKDVSLHAFNAFATELGRSLGHGLVIWPDPASGLPQKGPPGLGVFCEISAVESYRVPGYSFTHVGGPAGGCRVLQHPRWGCAVYPASILVSGVEPSVLCEAIHVLATKERAE